MNNILDYLAWRGDLSFMQSPFCDVDGLILCRLAYLPFNGIIPEQGSPLALRDVSVRCLQQKERELTHRNDAELLRQIINSKRFTELKALHFIDRFDAKLEKQFSATTFILPDHTLCVAFRGTDGTLVGWKEDFNMSFEDSVPAQQEALAYLENIASKLPGGIRIVGHSKGGNLAVYAAAFCSADVQRRIIAITNNDGPGFNSEVITKPGFRRITDKTKTYIPQSSVIGLLLEHAGESFTVIHSASVGLLQHDLYSWEVMRNGFVPVDSVTDSSKYIDRALSDWVENMTPDVREKMIDGIYSILQTTHAVTFRELWGGHNTIAMLKAISELDPETRQLLSEAFSILRHSLKNNLPSFLPNPAALMPGKN